jgi:hypothetical protein
VNVLDLVIVILLVTSIGGGWRLGLLTGATSWVLLVQSLVVATLVLPAVVTTVGGKDPGMRLMVGILLFVSAGFGGQQLGLLVGRRFHRSLLPEEGPARHWDKVAGAVAAPVAVLLALWLLVLPPLVDAAGSLSDLARHSAVARAIDAAFPDAPETSQALRRLAGHRRRLRPRGRGPGLGEHGPDRGCGLLLRARRERVQRGAGPGHDQCPRGRGRDPDDRRPAGREAAAGASRRL